jgi:hypothetical protein
VSVAKIDVETLRCIFGEPSWELCKRLKNARRELAELEARVEKLFQAVA